MNLPDRKTRFLGNYNHDFPRLAKQSGFFFQLNRGKVNWSEIEYLNLDDIIENRNFELLEQNLLNVINCNLEKDHDLKILDKNFVKLFKLAQLGIDYLSYCELYLDRCVVLLQEQLMSIQEEVETLKCENEKKNSGAKTLKTKKKINNYQCEKCEKIFISDVYLKYHDKRRHSNLSTPKSDEIFFNKSVDASQQTENGEKFSVAIQTVPDETITAVQKNEEIRKIKKSHKKKIKRMERNVNDLNARLQRAEKCLQESREAKLDSTSVGFPSSLHYHALLQLMPPCFPQSGNTDEVVADHRKILPTRSAEPELEMNVNTKASEGEKSFTTSNELIKECDKEDNGVINSESVKTYLISDKENVDPLVTKPLPPPRKTKKKLQNNPFNEENLTIETFDKLSNSVQSAADVPFTNRTTNFNAVKEKSDPNIISEILDEVKASSFEDTNGKNISKESLNVHEEKSKELKTFLRKAVGRSSPKSQIKRLSKNLKRPFANLYDSVSSTGKNLKRFQSPKSVLVEDLNDQLRELGIDPEWKGIPKKTMKQKLKDLAHRRKLLSMENPLYPSVRHSAEERLIERLKKNFFIRKTSSQKSSTQSLVEEIHPKDENPRYNNQEAEEAENKNYAILYDTDESCSRVSELEKNTRREVVVCPTPKPIVTDSESEEESVKLGEKEFNINVFQIKGVEKRQDECRKDTMLNEIDELLTNSDFEEDFSIRYNNGIFNGFNFDKNNYGKRCVKITN